MGFFDKFKKKKPAEEQTAVPETSAAGDILGTASLPPKPDFTVKDDFGDKEFSFRLSGDFIEFNSHSEADPSFQYEPLSDEEYTAYDENLPIISICPNDTIYEAAENFENDGTLPEGEYQKCAGSYFLFTASLEERGRVLYAYAFAGGTAREYEALCLEYPPAVAGTELEKKLKAILDRAAESYSECEPEEED